MDLTALKGMLPDVGRSPLARSTGLLLHNLSAAAVRMNTYEFVSHMSSDGMLYDDPEVGPDIRGLLSSKFDAEKSEGLKRLLALISAGADVSSFFPDVIKVVVSQSMPVKRMAYTFLAHFSSRRADEALMVINTLQKELGSPNALTRAHGIRAMAAMRLRSATPVVLLSVRRCSRDPSPFVRRCAALTLASVHALECPGAAAPPLSGPDPDSPADNNSAAGVAQARRGSGGAEDEILELLDGLLGDADASVVGAAACAYSLVCPWRMEPLGQHFRSLCHTLPVLDEWGQAAALDLLLRYSVAKFGKADRSRWPAEAAKSSMSGGGGGAGQAVSAWRGGAGAAGAPGAQGAGGGGRPEDLQLVLRSTRGLLQSESGAVALGAAALHWELNADVGEVQATVPPALLLLLRSSPHCQLVVLECISSMAAVLPELFTGRVQDLFVFAADSRPVRRRKLELLVLLARESNTDAIMRELEDYVQDLDPWFALQAIQAVGACAVRIPSVRTPAVRGLLQLLAMHCDPAQDNSNSTGTGGGSRPGEKPQGSGGEHASAAESTSTPGGARASGGAGQDSTSSQARPGSPGSGLGLGAGALSCRQAQSAVVLEVLLALRRIVELSPEHHLDVMLLLLPRLATVQPQQAQAVVVWMLGAAAQSSGAILRAAPYALHPLVLRMLRLQSSCLKLQLLDTALRVMVLLTGELGEPSAQRREAPSSSEQSPPSAEVPTLESILHFATEVLRRALECASADPCIDVRDRSRVIRGLLAQDGLLPAGPGLGNPGSLGSRRSLRETLTWKAFLGKRPGPKGSYGLDSGVAANGLSEVGRSELDAGWNRFPLSSLSHYVNHMTPSYVPLPKGRSLPGALALAAEGSSGEKPDSFSASQAGAEQPRHDAFSGSEGDGEGVGGGSGTPGGAMKAGTQDGTGLGSSVVAGQPDPRRESSSSDLDNLGSSSELENWLGSS